MTTWVGRIACDWLGIVCGFVRQVVAVLVAGAIGDAFPHAVREQAYLLRCAPSAATLAAWTPGAPVWRRWSHGG